MRILFMGSAEFACPALEALLGSRHEVVACVTQPDRPRGRHLKVAACPVKALATARGVRTLTPERIGDAYGELASLHPDLAVVAAYGQYIPARISDLPRHRSVNIHPSLLPRYRGAAPVQWALASGETMTGVSIQYVAPKMDAGDLVLQQEFEIRPDDTATTLEPRLARAGAELVLRAVDLLDAGHAHPTPQDEAKATWARKLEKSDAQLDWNQPAVVLHNRVRGFQPWPGAHCAVRGKQLKVLRTRVEAASGVPGSVLEGGAEGPLVACGTGALRLLEVQPEGRRAMAGGDYLRGAQLFTGDTLG